MLKLNMTLRCYLCHTAIDPLRSIIYECKNCQLAIIENKKIFEDLSEIYNFKNYHIEEKKHKKRFTNLIAITRKFMKKGEVLDVGGGFGLFSKLLAKTGQYKIEVIEPSALKILNENGFLIIQTPNYQSLMAKICKNWSWWMPRGS